MSSCRAVKLSLTSQAESDPILREQRKNECDKIEVGRILSYVHIPSSGSALCLMRQASFHSLVDAEAHKEAVARGERRLSHKAYQGALMINIYRSVHAMHACKDFPRHTAPTHPHTQTHTHSFSMSVCFVMSVLLCLRDEPRFSLPFEILRYLGEIDNELMRWRREAPVPLDADARRQPRDDGAAHDWKQSRHGRYSEPAYSLRIRFVRVPVSPCHSQVIMIIYRLRDIAAIATRSLWTSSI